jgi:hypothetical protein
MRHKVMLLAISALLVFISAGVLRAKEEPVAEADIPKVVMDALKAKFSKAKIDKCVKEKEGGDVIYDIEFKQENRKCEADIKADGTYLNYEKAIEAKDLPKAVTAAIEKRYPKSTFKEVMEETEVKGKEEKLAAYEVVLTTSDKKEEEVRVSTDGKILEDSGEEKK